MKKTVRGWAVCNPVGLIGGNDMLGYLVFRTKPRAEAGRLHDAEKVIPCTITYELPSKRKRV